MAEKTYAERPKTIFKGTKIRLSTKNPVKGDHQRPTLELDVNGESISIIVKTQDPNDKGNDFGRIQAKFGIYDFLGFVEMFKDIIDGPEDNEKNIKCKISYHNNQKLEKPVDGACVHVGKRKDGVVYICVEDIYVSGRPSIVFPFRPSYWHSLSENGNNPMSEKDVSIFYARAFVNGITRMIELAAVNTYQHVDRRPPNGGGGGGNYRSNNGGGGSNYRSNNNGGGNNGGGYKGNTSDGGGDNSGGDDDDGIPF